MKRSICITLRELNSVQSFKGSCVIKQDKNLGRNKMLSAMIFKCQENTSESSDQRMGENAA